MAKQTNEVSNTKKSNQLTRSDFNKTVQEAGINSNEQIGDLLKMAKFVNPEELETLTSEYVELEDGETYVFFVKGIAVGALPSKKNPDERVDAVELIDENGRELINADSVMVSTMRRLYASGKLPCMINVYVDGLSKSAAGSYKNLIIKRY